MVAKGRESLKSSYTELNDLKATIDGSALPIGKNMNTGGKQIEIIYSKNKMNRISITPTRITLKLVENPDQNSSVKDFFLSIAEDMEKSPRALRGFLGRNNEVHLRDNQMRLIKVYTYAETREELA